MRAIVCGFMMLFCLYGIPAEKWERMDAQQQDVALDDIAQEMFLELGCDEVEESIAVSGKWLLVYGECTEGQYIAYWKGGDL